LEERKPRAETKSFCSCHPADRKKLGKLSGSKRGNFLDRKVREGGTGKPHQKKSGIIGNVARIKKEEVKKECGARRGAQRRRRGTQVSVKVSIGPREGRQNTAEERKNK